MTQPMQQITDLQQLFINDVPLMDVRAPIEFIKGAFPFATNHPLMDDAERQQVGTCYKQHGQPAAIALGHKLVSGKTKAERIEAWHQFALRNPHGVLYCFRGGLRSKISQEWLHSNTGIDYPRVTGGYKAMRQYLLDTTHQALQKHSFIVIGGLTGSGKTELITQLKNSLDLEGHANHRGSSFGKRVHGQPSQIDFENRLAIDILKKQFLGIEQFVLEDEGHSIGRCSLPQELHVKMQHYPMVWLEDTLENRAQRILKTYVIEQRQDYIANYGQDLGFQQYSNNLVASLQNIQKRLGHERYLKLSHSMNIALDIEKNCGATDLHLHWIEPMLIDYFDPMYTHQRQQKAARIRVSGNEAEIAQYLMHYNRPL